MSSKTSRSSSLPVPEELLCKSQKILFIAHLALGDFTYLQNFFKEFSNAYPHLQIHLWVDEVRRTNNTQEWKYLEKYSLYDWVENCPFFHKIYKRTYSTALLKESVIEARAEHYPIVVSLATLRPHFYANLARQISPAGFVAGMKPKFKLFQFHHLTAYRKLDAAIQPQPKLNLTDAHITDIYAEWFRQAFGLKVPPQLRRPFVNIPGKWTLSAKSQLRQWGFPTEGGQIVFINAYAKTKKRCWPLESVAELIIAMRKQGAWRDAWFIINAVPQELETAKKTLGRYKLERTQLFSAQENFFELPAILRHCGLIISVETAVMHLANAVGVPVIALMRQKNPEWAPIDRDNSIVINAARRSDWVKQIPVEQVLAELPLVKSVVLAGKEN